MMKNKSKGKQRQSLRTSISQSQKHSKAKPSLSQGRKSKSCVPATVESFESEPEDSENSLSADVVQQSHTGRVETADEDSDFHFSERVSPGPVTTSLQSSTSTSIVPATLSSTITKWMSKKATASNDQNTRRLLGQIATVVPLQGSSQYGKAHEEAVRGLTRASQTLQPSSSNLFKSSKGKEKAVSPIFKVSSIIFLPYGTNKGPPEHSGFDDAVREEDYTDIIRVSKAPDEAYIQRLEQQCLAVRDVTHGFEIDTSWSYEEICYYLRILFPFLFRYFKEGPETAYYATETPFLVVHKSHQMLTAVPYESSSLNGEVLKRNCMLQKKGFHALKLYFVTRHVIPLAVLMSWSRGEFITLPPPSSAQDGILSGPKRSQPVKAKRKRAPSTPTTSDGEVVILDGGSILEMRSPPRKRLTRAGKASQRVSDSHNTTHATDDSETLLESPTSSKHEDAAATDLDMTVTVLPEMQMNADGPDERSDFWENYDPSNFGPDITVAGSSASTSTRPGHGAILSDVNTDAGGQRDRTPFLDADTQILSSQQSFSDLNINHSHEDPYGADVDIPFGF